MAIFLVLAKDDNAGTIKGERRRHEMVEDQKVEENLLAPGFTMEKTNRAWPFNFHFFFGPVVFELFTSIALLLPGCLASWPLHLFLFRRLEQGREISI